MWTLPGLGIEFIYPALAGEFLTTDPPTLDFLKTDVLKLPLLLMCLFRIYIILLAVLIVMGVLFKGRVGDRQETDCETGGWGVCRGGR